MINHEVLCSQRRSHYYPFTVRVFASNLLPTFRKLLAANKVVDTGFNVLDLIRFESERCVRCRNSKPAFHDDCLGPDPSWILTCRTPCKDLAEHCEKMGKTFRGEMAKKSELSHRQWPGQGGCGEGGCDERGCEERGCEEKECGESLRRRGWISRMRMRRRMIRRWRLRNWGCFDDHC